MEAATAEAGGGAVALLGEGALATPQVFRIDTSEDEPQAQPQQRIVARQARRPRAQHPGLFRQRPYVGFEA